jgi:hypothetical protein
MHEQLNTAPALGHGKSPSFALPTSKLLHSCKGLPAYAGISKVTPDSLLVTVGPPSIVNGH